MDKETIINALKSHIDPSEYSLNDWDRIYERREKYSENIYIFKCAFCDLWIYEDGSFYTADPHIPPSWGYSKNNDFSDDEISIIDSLKSLLEPKDYDLVDWRTVLLRVEKVSEKISKYDLGFCKVYLTDDNKYYDCEPIEVDDDSNILEKNLSYDELLKVRLIKRYVLPKHYGLINWKYVLKNIIQVKSGVYKYPLGVMDLYLDENLEVIDYDRCHIINDEFWYDFNTYPLIGGEQYTFITKL